jgi:hypothetical protein
VAIIATKEGGIIVTKEAATTVTKEVAIIATRAAAEITGDPDGTINPVTGSEVTTAMAAIGQDAGMMISREIAVVATEVVAMEMIAEDSLMAPVIDPEEIVIRTLIVMDILLLQIGIPEMIRMGNIEDRDVPDEKHRFLEN